jgi:hypothetical protein
MARKKKSHPTIPTVEDPLPDNTSAATATKPSGATPSPEAILAHEATLNELRTELADLATEIADAKARVRDLGERQRETTEEYARVKNRGPETMPLFDGRGPGAEPLPADAWRSLSIAEALGLSAGLAKKLQAAGIETLGQFSDFVGRHGDFWPKDLKGVGPAAAEDLSDRFTDFWARHPEFCQEAGHA